MAAPSAVRVEVSADGFIHTVILHRPTARNAVDGATAEQLATAFRKFDADPVARVAVLYGDGGVFCAGADLKAFASGTSVNTIGPVGEYDGPMGPTRMTLTKPVIAAVSGFAVAGGLELACWCDLRVVEEDATMGVFCRRWGVPLIDGGTIRLPRLIGLSHAMDLILTGRAVAATEAKAIGLANRVVPKGQARQAAEELAAQIAKFPQLCMRHDRLSAIEQDGMSITAALANEYEHGLISMTEAAAGATRFAGGEGRHGAGTGLPKGAAAGAAAASAEPNAVDAVVFDLGGVMVDSPLVGIAKLERKLGLDPHALNLLIMGAGKDGAFQRMERGELTVEAFSHEFDKELKGRGLPSVANEFMTALVQDIQVRPAMVEAAKILRAHGIKTGLLTNNFKGSIVPDEVRANMDVVIESCVFGNRKPDPAIYQAMLEQLRVPPARVVFLDDIGANLKAAASLGMRTIKVALDDHQGLGAIQQLQSFVPRAPLVRQLAKFIKPRL